MASLALCAAVAPATSSFAGQKLRVQSVKPVASTRTVKVAAPRAKYGDESVYFDLKDLGNTTGAWDLYGSDSPSPYNGLQATFFETFAGAFTKRGILLKILVLGYTGAIGHFAATSTGDILAIKKGPQGPPTPGPNGKI